MLASEVGLSAAYVRQLIAVAVAFEDESSRAADLSFSHHVVAAMTEAPQGWIERAVEQAWSVKEMRQAIRDAKDRIDEAEQARRAGERLEQAVRKFNEHFAGLAGRRAVLSWEATPARHQKNPRPTPGEDAVLFVTGLIGPDGDPAMVADAVALAEEVWAER